MITTIFIYSRETHLVRTSNIPAKLLADAQSKRERILRHLLYRKICTSLRKKYLEIVCEISWIWYLCRESTYFRRALSARIGANGTGLSNLDKEKRYFVQMARLIEAADRCLATHHGASFGCNVANLCLLMYSVIFYPNFNETAAFIIWLISCCLDVLAVCFGGIMVYIGVW